MGPILYLKRIAQSDILRKIGLNYMKAFLWERSLEMDIPEIKPRIPANAVILSDCRDLEKFSPIKSEWLKRLKNGDLCCAIVIGNKILGYLWISFKEKVYITEFEREIKFRSNTAYLYDGFISPNLRRKGLFKKILENTLLLLKVRNIEKVYVYTSVINDGVNKALRALYFKPVKIIKFVKIFNYKRMESKYLS